MDDNINVFRKTPVLLVARLGVLELILAVFYVFGGNLLIWSGLIFWKWVFYLLITLSEMAVVLMIGLKWANEMYTVKSSGLIHRSGLLAINEETISLKNVQAVVKKQSFWGRIFNFGSIKFYSPILKQEYVIEDIPDPATVKTLIESEAGLGDNKENKQVIIPIRNTKN